MVKFKDSDFVNGKVFPKANKANILRKYCRICPTRYRCVTQGYKPIGVTIDDHVEGKWVHCVRVKTLNKGYESHDDFKFVIPKKKGDK